MHITRILFVQRRSRRRLMWLLDPWPCHEQVGCVSQQVLSCTKDPAEIVRR